MTILAWYLAIGCVNTAALLYVLHNGYLGEGGDEILERMQNGVAMFLACCLIFVVAWPVIAPPLIKVVFEKK